MSRHYAKLVREVHEKTGYIPNIANHQVRPGTILRRKAQQYVVEGTLWQRAEKGGDAELAQKLKDRMNALTPVPGAGDATRHALGLKFESEGTRTIASETTFKMPLQVGPTTIEVDANLVLEFSREQDYLFDTTAPCPWFTFADTDYPDVIDAALRFMQPGELLVTGAAFAENWLWYISKSKEGKVAFKASGDLKGIPLDAANVADIVASAQLSVVAKEKGVVDGRGTHSVACFAVRKLTKPWWSGTPNLESSISGIRTAQGTSLGTTDIEVMLTDPDAADLEALGGD